MTREEAIWWVNHLFEIRNLPPVNQKQITSKLENAENATSKGEESTMSQPKSKLDCISRQQAVEAVTNTIREKFSLADWYEQLVETGLEIENLIESLSPVTPTEQNEEDILKFYYVESLDEYWIGQRCGTRYYGKWTGNCFTFGYSRYLPWGEHVVAPDTLWKEHTYPSEPKEIPFNEWLQGFLEKECQTERTGEWIEHDPKTSGRSKPSCGRSKQMRFTTDGRRCMRTYCSAKRHISRLMRSTWCRRSRRLQIRRKTYESDQRPRR